jgi:hypothetical protein
MDIFTCVLSYYILNIISHVIYRDGVSLEDFIFTKSDFRHSNSYFLTSYDIINQLRIIFDKCSKEDIIEHYSNDILKRGGLETIKLLCEYLNDIESFNNTIIMSGRKKEHVLTTIIMRDFNKKEEKEETIKYLLDKGITLGDVSNEYNPLIFACKNREKKIMEIIIEKYPSYEYYSNEFNVTDGHYHSCSPNLLMISCINDIKTVDNLEFIDYLVNKISFNIDMSHAGLKFITVFIRKIKKIDDETRYLIEKLIKHLILFNENRMSLENRRNNELMSFVCENKFEDILKILIYDRYFLTFENSLIYCYTNRNYKMVEMLLQNDVIFPENYLIKRKGGQIPYDIKGTPLYSLLEKHKCL